jgi:3-methyladenine DNA glycosylase AlkD
MNYEEVIKKLKLMGSPKNLEGMARYGINKKNNLGISIYRLRSLAKEIGTNHELSLKLWESGIHDARLLAVFIEDPSQVSEEQMDHWVNDFDSWDICDQACTSLFDLTPYAYKKVFEWAERNEEFVKRAAFSIIAGIAVHDKETSDEKFGQFAHLIIKHATDERNYVKKAVNWALRNIGKRNISLNKKMISLSKEILLLNSKSAHWIANDALRELNSEKIRKKLKKNIK